MKTKIIFLSLMTLCFLSKAQKITNGPELDNDRNNKMNRMLEGDDNDFYAYRIRTKGRGTSYCVEKYSKDALKPTFSKDVEIEEDRYTKVEDVKYAQDNVIIFIRQYDKKDGKMTLNYCTVSSNGTVNNKLQELFNVTTDHYEFIDFDVYENPGKTKFLVKTSYKESKDDQYKTKFILYDAKSMKQLFSKQVALKLFSGQSMMFSFWGGFSLKNTDFIGLMLDDEDNIYYGYTYLDKTSTDKNFKYKLAMGIIPAKSQDAKIVELEFDDNYYVGNVKFTKPNATQIVAGGFLKDVIERRGRDLVKVGIFSFSVNIEKGKIDSKAVNLFNDKILASLESNPKRSKYFKYKLDYIIASGNSVYYIGEQYREQYVQSSSYGAPGFSAGVGGIGVGTAGSSSSHWEYEYMDVIIAKLNAKGEFEWIKNTPLRINMSLQSPHVFKQYIAVMTNKSIYILNDEHEKNLERYAKADYEPSDLKNMSGIHGTNFVSSAVDLGNGAITHKLVFENESYCFAPIQERNIAYMPPPDAENFVKGKSNEIYIYTEDRGRDRFSKITFE